MVGPSVWLCYWWEQYVPPRRDSYRHRVVVERNPVDHFHRSRCRAYLPSWFEPPLGHPTWCILHEVRAWHEPGIVTPSIMQNEKFSILPRSVASMILIVAVWSVWIHLVGGRRVTRNRMSSEYRSPHGSNEVWHIDVHRQCTNQPEELFLVWSKYELYLLKKSRPNGFDYFAHFQA